MDHEKMGRFIAEQRKAKGMTQRDLADRLHITDKAISKWERGLSSPDIGLLSQLSDELGVSVNDLLMGEVTNSSAEDPEVNVILQYAESNDKKKYNRFKLWCSISVTALLLLGIVVCALVDVAVTDGFTWSLYPIVSIVFVWFLVFPFMLWARKGLIPSMIVLTILVHPYLYALDLILNAEGSVFQVGAPIALICLAFLWSTLFLIMRCFKNRKLIGAGIATILAAPVCILINVSLSLTLTPEAAAFDAWDILDVIILGVAGLGMICFDLIIRNAKKG